MDYKKQLIEDINKYIPFNEEEEKDKIVILNALRSKYDYFNRTNLFAHFSASAWVLSKGGGDGKAHL